MTWRVVIPFKGAPSSKSRLAARFDDLSRHALALAFLQDVVAAVRETPGVDGVTLVSSEPGLAALFPETPGLAPVELTPDPRHGLNGAIAHGIRVTRAADPAAHVAVLLGDLPELTATELGDALGAAVRHPLAYVADAAGTGTSLITLAPGAVAEPRFGAGSAAAHAAAGFALLDVPAASGLRRDVDAPDDVDVIVAPGQFTRAVLAALR
ncbi:2-phospho-L-lactate guanylyltransferase [Gryllotalpicola protaetiae]|uniref:Phosphoenolpyruvate guanylyltransferase n=1 Tax=Gryllotalpicola protaetiae TaxID=2419771 RepID=A0A387BQI0_9MICO|nr:2-phospho-L-lactate guanylyltransferase [Gryllotalpicola protaetiae]AYG03290.1 2-phospho-L-lactate guanylyltransferase [Gryllotalpicola protaetiae]